jgi:hypothetical protein
MAATEDSPSGGGFLVPPDQAATVWDQILESEIVRPRATVIPMASESRKWPAVQDDDHFAGTLYGGMNSTGGWSSELEDLNTADIKMRVDGARGPRCVGLKTQRRTLIKKSGRRRDGSGGRDGHRRRHHLYGDDHRYGDHADDHPDFA